MPTVAVESKDAPFFPVRLHEVERFQPGATRERYRVCKRRIDLAQDGITAAEKSLKLNLERIENAQGLPIEALQAVQALAAARLAYLNAVIDYNIAQFELCRATGWFMQGA